VNNLIAEGPLSRTVIDAPSIGVEVEVVEPSEEAIANAAEEVVHNLVAGHVSVAVSTP
jgi:hypothetical protein